VSQKMSGSEIKSQPRRKLFGECAHGPDFRGVMEDADLVRAFEGELGGDGSGNSSGWWRVDTMMS
jgi:hypothetical protein